MVSNVLTFPSNLEVAQSTWTQLVINTVSSLDLDGNDGFIIRDCCQRGFVGPYGTSLLALTVLLEQQTDFKAPLIIKPAAEVLLESIIDNRPVGEAELLAQLQNYRARWVGLGAISYAMAAIQHPAEAVKANMAFRAVDENVIRIDVDTLTQVLGSALRTGVILPEQRPGILQILTTLMQNVSSDYRDYFKAIRKY